MKREYRICRNCVMDTTDSGIVFDENGVCDHCNGFYKYVAPNWHTDERGRRELNRIVDSIRTEGKGREFDCIMGLSGGADSSYMLHIAVKEYGLRPLVFHVDGGWNTQIAVNNIEVMVDELGLDLYTEVIDWEEMKDLQLSYIKSSLPGIDIPQDHAFAAVLYKFASKHNIKYILNGGNYSTECVRNPMEWIYYGSDLAQIRDVHGRFGQRPLVKYPLSNILWHKVYLRFVRGIQVVKPLNYVPYVKQEAMDLLASEYEWQPYPQKHFESRFTRFFEGYWLPRKFGYDTRKVQFSSLILTNQMTREEALRELESPALDDETAMQDLEYVATKLGITDEEMMGYIEAPNKTYRDYKNSESMFVVGARVMRLLGMERAIKR